MSWDIDTWKKNIRYDVYLPTKSLGGTYDLSEIGKSDIKIKYAGGSKIRIGLIHKS